MPDWDNVPQLTKVWLAAVSWMTSGQMLVRLPDTVIHYKQIIILWESNTKRHLTCIILCDHNWKTGFLQFQHLSLDKPILAFIDKSLSRLWKVTIKRQFKCFLFKFVSIVFVVRHYLDQLLGIDWINKWYNITINKTLFKKWFASVSQCGNGQNYGVTTFNPSVQVFSVPLPQANKIKPYKCLWKNWSF